MRTFLWEKLSEHISIRTDKAVTYLPYSKTGDFLDNRIYKNTNSKLCLTYRKPADLQNYLHFKSSQKHFVISSHVISNICTESNEVMKHLAKLKEAFLKRSYQETIDDRFDRLNHQKQLTKKKRCQPKFRLCQTLRNIL